jgi:hypothetical protein
MQSPRRAVSRRTPTRRLAEERASFRQILDQVRGDFARAFRRIAA